METQSYHLNDSPMTAATLIRCIHKEKEPVRLPAILAVAAAILFTSCTPAPKPTEVSQDATQQPWYTQSVAELTKMNHEAEDYLQKGQGDQASALILKGEPLKKRILSVSHPSLDAAVAASDLDQLYGRMLFSNHHYGWARMLFQQDLARWKYWKTQSPETERRLKRAQDAIIECDQHLD